MIQVKCATFRPVFYFQLHFYFFVIKEKQLWLWVINLFYALCTNWDMSIWCSLKTLNNFLAMQIHFEFHLSTFWMNVETAMMLMSDEKEKLNKSFGEEEAWRKVFLFTFLVPSSPVNCKYVRRLFMKTMT